MRDSRNSAVVAIAACLAAAAGGPAEAASDPIYVHIGPDGHRLFTNHDAGGAAVLVLAGDTAQVDAFRRRFRAAQRGADDSGDAVASRPGGLPKRIDPALLEMVDAAARREGLNAQLVRAVVLVESGFQPAARSWANARGLMQLLPATAARFGVPDARDLRDPEANLRAGTGYLAFLLRLFDGDVRLALAGYNAGEGAVIKHGRRVPPYPETQAYVPAVLSAWRAFAESETAASSVSPHLSAR